MSFQWKLWPGCTVFWSNSCYYSVTLVWNFPLNPLLDFFGWHYIFSITEQLIESCMTVMMDCGVCWRTVWSSTTDHWYVDVPDTRCCSSSASNDMLPARTKAVMSLSQGSHIFIRLIIFSKDLGNPQLQYMEQSLQCKYLHSVFHRCTITDTFYVCFL